MSKRNHIVERASDVNGGQYIQTNPSYNSGYEDGKKAGKEYCAAEIASLREQVEKLTKERDALKTVPMKYRRMQFNAELQDEVTQLQKQLLALAEQNEKMRKVLLRLACLGNGDQYGNSIGNCIAQEALSLPDLATPVLNQIKAEAYREAAEICEKQGDRARTSTGAARALACEEAIRAKADELEKQS